MIKIYRKFQRCLKLVLVQILVASVIHVLYFGNIFKALDKNEYSSSQAQRKLHEHDHEQTAVQQVTQTQEKNVKTAAEESSILAVASKVDKERLANLIPQILDPHGVSCRKLFANDSREISRAKTIQRSIVYNETQETLSLYKQMKKCSEFLTNRQYISVPVNSEEESFPIAYSILTYRDATQTERLLRSIYRPQNYYCIHVDLKASFLTHLTIQRLASCLPNVFIASETIDVQWGWYSVAEPEVACLWDLIKFKKWKYFINLTGQEFPLKTNLEIVQILKTYDGANDIQATAITKASNSIKRRFVYGYTKGETGLKMYQKPKFPHNITWAKGAVHVAASRAFVSYLLFSQVGRDLIAWVNDTSHASEHLFNPLQLSPQLGVPGAYTGKSQSSSAGSKIRYKIWKDHKQMCFGKIARDICIFGVGDVYHLRNTAYMIANKFHADFEPIAYTCLEQLIYNQTRRDVLGFTQVQTKVYKNIDFVKNHLPAADEWTGY